MSRELAPNKNSKNDFNEKQMVIALNKRPKYVKIIFYAG